MVGRPEGSANFEEATQNSKKSSAVPFRLTIPTQTSNRPAARGEKSEGAAREGAAPPELPGHVAGFQAMSQAADELTPPTPQKRSRVDDAGEIPTYSNTCSYTSYLYLFIKANSQPTNHYIYINIYTYAHIHTHTNIYTHIYTNTYIYIYIHLFVCSSAEDVQLNSEKFTGVSGRWWGGLGAPPASGGPSSSG
jgi:hypothetical protein